MKELKHSRVASVVVLLLIILATQVTHFKRNSSNEKILSRQKRLFFFTSNRRFALPPTTLLAITLTFNLPFLNDLPVGYSTNMLISFPFVISFDDLGLTSEENPFGQWPLRKRREAPNFKHYPEYGHTPKDAPLVDITEGDRRVLYQIIEGVLHNMGLEGSPCLQRAICEFFQEPLKYHGFFGEMIELLFSPSNSPEADIHLKEYVEAEKTGKSTGKCDLYQRLCSRSFYTNGTSEHIAVDAKDRQKRFIYITPERRITFPPTTSIFVTFNLNLPSGRLLKTGYGSGLSISLPISFNLDDLGLTTEDHPFADFRNFTFLDELFRLKREVGEQSPGINWAGGDREVMYFTIETTLESIGMNGKACLLRAICEMFQAPLDRYGILGEALEIFFSPSLSPYAEFRLDDYLEAELVGRSSGVCVDYEENCPHSLFTDAKFESSHPIDIINSLMSVLKHKST
ncbi:uncharacterized protein [Palaemon carinicauda]|uniref:uncharacterized protein isoform X1 n=1 Tax=Palaemon carinicauda TaxID=392227 RepID=UPI0035B6655B